ncbi:MAG: YeeE/YedE family protein [Acidobacteria bacterium]|nr:YeeE/YedE family protein [Acidobacteriota bacterium]
MTLLYLALGTLFGFVLSRAGAADYDYIQGMFLFERFQLYGILATGVAVTAPGLWLLKKYGRTLTGAPLAIDRKSLNKGTVAGSLLFGIGWSLTGMCPGPILVNIGEGKVYAIAALAGALVGAALFGAAYDALQKPFGLPALKVTARGAAGH